MAKDEKQSQQEEIFDETINYVLQELRGESERACAIVGAAYLDGIFEKILEEYLLENKDAYKDLLSSKNANSPLSSFSARIIVSYGIGLINKNQKEAFHLIRKIRNLFAHDIMLKFSDDVISNRCKELKIIFPDLHYLSTSPSSREIFQSVTAYLAGTLREKLNLITKFQISGTFSSVLEIHNAVSYLVNR